MFKKGRIPIINELTPNEVMDLGEYHLSYNPFSADYGSRTTALVLANTVFLILDGDHRTQMAGAADTSGLQGCFDYFLENLDCANHNSEHHLILKGNNTFGVTDSATKYLGEENIARLISAAKELQAASILAAEADATEDVDAPGMGM